MLNMLFYFIVGWYHFMFSATQDEGKFGVSILSELKSSPHGLPLNLRRNSLLDRGAAPRRAGAAQALRGPRQPRHGGGSADTCLRPDGLRAPHPRGRADVHHARRGGVAASPDRVR